MLTPGRRKWGIPLTLMKTSTPWRTSRRNSQQCVVWNQPSYNDGAASARMLEALRTEATRGDFKFGWNMPLLTPSSRPREVNIGELKAVIALMLRT
jgi:hypothetical protein